MRMLRRGSGIICVILLCYSSFTNATQREKDAVLQTIEEFSGYPIQEPPPPSIPIPRTLKIHILDLQKQIDKLSTFSDTPAPSVTRILFTENDILARRYVKGLMNNAGLSVREDSVGNIFGRWIGCDPELAPVATGSHIDAIPHSGKYDGVVGVLGSIEAISALKRSGFRPKRSIEIIMFTSEEPTRFGISCLGSRLLSGSTTVEKRLGDMVDGENVSFVSSARAAGYAADLHGNFSTVFLKQGSYCAFLELHIEQGPLLEEEGISIGIVSAIAAPASISVTFRGNGGHAGALLMPFRNDAGLAAAELALAVEKHVLHSNSIDTVGTVGVMELHPGAINSIPSKARVEIDVRDIEELRRDDVVEKIHNSAKQIAARRGVELSELRVINQDPPATSDRTLVHMIEAVSVELNLTHKRIISRAYHDSLFMARISPMGMIFIPCYKGYSHKPEEYASIDDIGNGVRVLAFVLARLSLS